MALHLDINSVESARTDTNFHLMPCKIEHNGDATVEQYFVSGIRDNDQSQGLTSSFRGRPLKGQKIDVPEGYTGLTLKEPRKTFNEDDERQLKVTHQFKEFTYWNLDSIPSANDKILAAMDWIDIAKAIHRPVDDENSQKSVTGN